MKPNLKKTIKQNYSYLRYLEHEIIHKIKPTGKYIDLGAKSDTERYYNYLDMSYVTEKNFCDIISDSPKVKKINLEEKFSLDSDHYETVIYFNVLEHIFNYTNLIDESYRILKDNGTAHVIVPFMWQYHGDPDDFNRFTYTALYRKYTDAGFNSVEIIPIGAGRFNVIAMHLSTIFKSKIYKLNLIRFFRILQKIEDMVSSNTHHFCLAYYIKAIK